MPKLPEMEEIKLSMGNEALNIPKKRAAVKRNYCFIKIINIYLFHHFSKSHYMVFTLKSIVSFLSDSKCVSLTPAYSNIFCWLLHYPYFYIYHLCIQLL